MPKRIQARSVIVPAGRGPADDGRQRAGHRADQRGQRRAPLERRVDHDIAHQGDRGDDRGDCVDLPREIDQPGRRENHAEPRAFRDAQPSDRDRARARTAHEAVALALPGLIERGSAARHEKRARQRVEQRRGRHAVRCREIHPAKRRQQDQEVETGLGECQKVSRRGRPAGRSQPAPRRRSDRGVRTRLHALASRYERSDTADLTSTFVVSRESPAVRTQRQHERRHEHQRARHDVQRVDDELLAAQHRGRAERHLQRHEDRERDGRTSQLRHPTVMEAARDPSSPG